MSENKNIQYRHHVDKDLSHHSYHNPENRFPQEKEEELINLFTDSFQLLNPIWRKLNIPRYFINDK